MPSTCLWPVQKCSSSTWLAVVELAVIGNELCDAVRRTVVQPCPPSFPAHFSWLRNKTTAHEPVRPPSWHFSSTSISANLKCVYSVEHKPFPRLPHTHYSMLIISVSKTVNKFLSSCTRVSLRGALHLTVSPLQLHTQRVWSDPVSWLVLSV